MKRKVNKVGQNTLTVSLPSEWSKKNKIEAGDELDLIEDNSNLIISPNFKKSDVNLKFDVSGLSRMINRLVTAAYKAGYRKLKIKYSSSDELEIIQNTIDRSCHVYEVMSVQNNEVEIDTISTLESENFKNVFRKLGFATIDMVKDLFIASKENNLDLMKSVILKDKFVDSYSDFTRRSLNAGHKVSFNKPFPVYVICEQVEILADVFKVLAEDIIAKEIKPTKRVLELFKEVLVLIEHFFDTLYAFDPKKVEELGIHEKRIKNLIKNFTKITDSEFICVIHLSNAFETAFEMKSALLTMHTEHFETTTK